MIEKDEKSKICRPPHFHTGGCTSIHGYMSHSPSTGNKSSVLIGRALSHLLFNISYKK